MAPGSQIADRLDLVRQVRDQVELSLPYVTYTLISYSDDAPRDRPVAHPCPSAIEAIPELYEQCMTHALTQGFWSTAIAKDQFVPEPELDAFLSVAAQNEPGTLKIAVPALIIQGDRGYDGFPVSDGPAGAAVVRGREGP